jgi:hypothetical protein
MGSRVDERNQALSCYGSTGFNLYSPTTQPYSTWNLARAVPSSVIIPSLTLLMCVTITMNPCRPVQLPSTCLLVAGWLVRDGGMEEQENEKKMEKCQERDCGERGVREGWKVVASWCLGLCIVVCVV